MVIDSRYSCSGLGTSLSLFTVMNNPTLHSQHSLITSSSPNQSEFEKDVSLGKELVTKTRRDTHKGLIQVRHLLLQLQGFDVGIGHAHHNHTPSEGLDLAL